MLCGRCVHDDLSAWNLGLFPPRKLGDALGCDAEFFEPTADAERSDEWRLGTAREASNGCCIEVIIVIMTY
jgi:hypothetical protein